jgi:hypothetical protein
LETLKDLPEWVTKAEFKAEYRRASFAMMKREIDRGKIAVKLDVDGRVKMNTADAKRAFGIGVDLYKTLMIKRLMIGVT